jgi:uncharacterized protein
LPHRCTECNSVLETGEMDLKTGCPVCGNKKFQYVGARKGEDKEKEKDLRKLTVSEYVAHAEAEESKGEKKHVHKETHPKEAPKPKPVETPEVEAVKTPEPKPEVESKKDKKHHERIESVRIVEKGSYDLNLPVLLNRKELVMSKEDGVYVVDLPSALKTTAAPKKKKR